MNLSFLDSTNKPTPPENIQLNTQENKKKINQAIK